VELLSMDEMGKRTDGMGEVKIEQKERGLRRESNRA